MLRSRERGLSATALILESRVRPCTHEEARRLRLAAGADLFEMRRLRSLDGLVVVLKHNRLPLSVCPLLPQLDFARASLYDMLRRADPPQVATVADYSVAAPVPDAAERELLQMDERTPVLVATQLAYNAAERPIKHTVAVYRSDRYQFTASITRRDG